jgi:signal transduction histidine kinase
MRRFLPGTLRGQLVLVILTTFLVVQGVSLILFVDERGMAVRAALGVETAGRAANVVRLLEATPEELLPDILRAADSPLVRFTVNPVASIDHLDHSAGGDISARIAGFLNDDTPREIRVELHRVSQPENMKIPFNMKRMHREMMGLDLASVEMQLAISLRDGRWLNVSTRFHKPPIQWPWGSTISFGLATLLIMAVVWFALSQLTGPLRKLAHAAERLGRGENVEPLPENGPEELHRLTRAFNDMQARLSRFVSERTRLLAALGHDLRSPLTAMRVRVEMVDDEETRDRLVSSIEEMQEMVQSTLSFARGMVTAEDSQATDFSVFLQELLMDIGQTDQRPDLQSETGLWVRIKPVAMRRGLRNVIENALRYGGQADLRAVREGATVRLSVADSGPGIPEADLERVFDPFVRVEKSRNLETGGTGLGLSIARTVIHAHGGEISLANRPEGGLIVTITLPYVEDAVN